MRESRKQYLTLSTNTKNGATRTYTQERTDTLNKLSYRLVFCCSQVSCSQFFHILFVGNR